MKIQFVLVYRDDWSEATGLDSDDILIHVRYPGGTFHAPECTIEEIGLGWYECTLTGPADPDDDIIIDARAPQTHVYRELIRYNGGTITFEPRMTWRGPQRQGQGVNN